jgi:hypothetical protein
MRSRIQLSVRGSPHPKLEGRKRELLVSEVEEDDPGDAGS